MIELLSICFSTTLSITISFAHQGALLAIAHRCLASDTNAWTGQDHTCYTMRTAGSEGFLNLLPIFLDHILNPTLNDSFFVTEVSLCVFLFVFLCFLFLFFVYSLFCVPFRR